MSSGSISTLSFVLFDHSIPPRCGTCPAGIRGRLMGVQDVLARLADVKSGAEEGKWTALCPVPAHGDTRKSLSIAEVNNAEGIGRKVLVNCFAGCSFDDIRSALQLAPAAFFEDNKGGEGNNPPRNPATAQPPHGKEHEDGRERVADGAQPEATAQPPAGLTLLDYANAKRFPAAFLRAQGLTDISYQKAPAVRIPYFAEDGRTILCTQFRLALTKTADGPDNRFKFKSGDKVRPYGLWRLHTARQCGYITLVEGASDCHTLWHLNEPALGFPGANNWKDERDAPLLDGIPAIYIVIEPDRGGETVRKWLATSRLRDRVRVLDLGEHKDPSALYLADPDGFARNWQAARGAATAWADMEAQERDQRASTAWRQCAQLARQPAILNAFATTLAGSGVAGEERVIKLLYLAVVSRFLDRPVSL